MASPAGISRRRLLAWSSGLSLLTGARVVFAAATAGRGASAGRVARCTAALVDTLIPRDQSPGATDLGVDRVILGKAGRRRRYRGVLAAGCEWLDGEARRGGAGAFHELDEAARIAVVEQAAGAPAGSLPRTFFDRMRDDALFVYYAHPRAWASLGYDGPPQPAGFMRHAGPPDA